MKSWSYMGIVVLLLSGVGIAEAQNKPRLSNSESAVTSNDLIQATRDYKANTESLLQMQGEELNKATQKLEQLRSLVADGLVAKNELEAAEESVAALQATLEATRKKIGDSDQLIAEIQSERIRKTQSVAQGGLVNKPRSFVRPTVLRYNGAAQWSIAHLAGVQNFFSSTFGRSLPTSTVGQSATHNRLGWDHRNSVDIPLHPDSVEGKTLISFLQTQGIPFLAFRGAVPGVSTGAHIHIGRPSQRLS
jgi:small-conductance mechanosensitive channel